MLIYVSAGPSALISATKNSLIVVVMGCEDFFGFFGVFFNVSE